MPRLKCPRCSTIVEAAEGAAPVCPQCGFGSKAPPTPPPAPAPDPVWAAPALSPLPAAAPSGPAKRPGWVTFVAVYYFIVAGFSLLVGLVALLAGGMLAAYFEEGAGEWGDIIGTLVAVVGVIVLLFGALALVVGLNVLKGRGWARITAMVLAIVGLVFSGLSVLVGDFSSIISIALDVLVLVALTRPESKAFFEASPRAA
jgi:hypothetical protein